MNGVEIARDVISILTPATVLLTLLVQRTLVRDIGVNSHHSARKRTYVFAVSNNEEVLIDRRIELKLRLLSGRGAFESSRFLCGPEHPIATETSQAEPTVQRETMRPLTTWLVECTTDGHELDAELVVTGMQHEPIVVSGRRAPRPKPRLGTPLRVVATVGALAFYLGLRTTLSEEARAALPLVGPIDLIMLAAIATAGLVTVIIARPPAPPPVFGYLGDTAVGSRETAKTEGA